MASEFVKSLPIQPIVFIFHAIGPFAAAYTSLRLAVSLFPGSLPFGLQRLRLPVVLDCWLFAEAAFYLAFQCYRPYLQRAAIHPPLRSREERGELFNRVKSNVTNAEAYIRGWFKQAKLEDIGRENVKSFLAWAFLEGRVDPDGKDEEELEQYVVETESLIGQRFAPGWGSAHALRLTLDPIDMWHRSLTWYSIIACVDFVTYFRLLFIGFQHYRQPLLQLARLFPFRPIALTASEISPAKHTSYWLRPHTSKTRLPVLFLHGIGVGLHFYVDFLRELDEIDKLDSSADDGQVGVLAIEMMSVATRITREMPGKEEFLDDISAILEKHSYDRFVLIAHSYGTIIVTHILHSRALRPKVSSVVLIDPVCFLLHNPDVCYNFTVRWPRKRSEWTMFYFAGKDPGVAHTLGRRFFWSENELWLEDLEPMIKEGLRVTVSLSGMDIIVETHTTGSYLAKGRVKHAESHVNGSMLESNILEGDESMDAWKHAEWEGKGLEVIWHEELDHAEVFDTKSTRAGLLKAIKEYCSGT